MATASGSGGNGPPYQPSTNNPNKTFNFLGLPAELRQKVYEYALAPAKTAICNFVNPNLLRVNREIYTEAHPVLRNYWVPRLRANIATASMDVKQMKKSMTKELDRVGKFIPVSFPVYIVLSSDAIRPFSSDPSVYSSSLMHAGRAAVTTESMAREIKKAIRATDRAYQDVVVHLDVSGNKDDINISQLFKFVRNLRALRVIIEIHAHPADQEPRVADLWVQELSRLIGQKPNMFSTDTTVTVRAWTPVSVK